MLRLLINKLLNYLQLFSNGTLLISKVYMEDQGRYGCVASNVAGKIRIEAFLSVSSKTKQIGCYQNISYHPLAVNP